MGIHELQNFIEGRCASACRPADLVQVARGAVTRPGRRGVGRLRLVVDAESCLDRLYGGFYSDWACGGQWNRMTNFLTTLMRACHQANTELVVFFNGALESQRLNAWAKTQQEARQNVQQVLKHLNSKATPPPKVWWHPPSCLHSSLRLALRQLGVEIALSMDDHHQEVIGFCRENHFHGLLCHDADYAIFDPPRYFSSRHLKLTYKGALETVEFVIDEVAKEIDLHPKRFCILAALLGTHILPCDELGEFYTKVLGLTGQPSQPSKVTVPPEEKIMAVVRFVRTLQSIENLDEVATEVFKYSTSNTAEKTNLFKQSIQYYLNGTQEGFLKYRPRIQSWYTDAPARQPGSYPGNNPPKKNNQKSAAAKTTQNDNKPVAKLPAVSIDSSTDDQSDGLMADNVYTQAESGYTRSSEDQLGAPQIVVDPPSIAHDSQDSGEADLEDKLKSISLNDGPELDPAVEFGDKPASHGASKTTASNKQSKQNARTNTISSNKKKEEKLPKISHEIMRIASDRHQKGLMHPWVYQILTQGELKVGVTLEDENNQELPPALELFRPARKKVYGILFDYNKQIAAWKTALQERKDGSAPVKPQVYVTEWVPERLATGAGAAHPDRVAADTLGWLAPGLHRLWLGQMVEDKNRRLRAFLSCHDSDVPLMLNTSYIPQHLVVLCCVLRCMLLYEKQAVLRRHELDAFLCAAVSPLLNDVTTMQEMKLPMITIRGVELASLFMRGVEHAIFINDACGAPIPWGFTCPWHFFDGKLFHFKLLKANNNTQLIDMCDGQVEQVMQVERMRQAILQNIIQPERVFAHPPLPMMAQGNPYHQPPYPGHQGQIHMRPAGAPPPQPMGGPPGHRMMGRGRGLLGRSPVDSRGGQLQIAGVVVGSWGANTQAQNTRPGGRGTHVAPPHVTSVGPRNRGGRGQGVVSTRARGARSVMRPASGGRPGPRYQVQPHRFFGGQTAGMMRGKGRSRGGGRGGGRHDGILMDYGMEHGIAGRGRGCTVESPDESGGVMQVSQLMKAPSRPDGSGAAGLHGSSIASHHMPVNEPKMEIGHFEEMCLPPHLGMNSMNGEVSQQGAVPGMMPGMSPGMVPHHAGMQANPVN